MPLPNVLLAALLAAAPLMAAAQPDEEAPLHAYFGTDDFRLCRDDAQTARDTDACLIAYRAELERGLGGVLGVARARAGTYRDPDEPDLARRLTAALDSAQAAWARYREAEAEFVYLSFWGGSGAGQFATFRSVALIEERIDALAEHFQLEFADLGDL